MRPACHLDTQNTVFLTVWTPKCLGQDLLMMTIFEDIVQVVSLQQYKLSSYWPKKAKSVDIYIWFISLVVCTLCHTLDTQKSMKPSFGRPDSKSWLGPCIGNVTGLYMLINLYLGGFQPHNFEGSERGGRPEFNVHRQQERLG